MICNGMVLAFRDVKQDKCNLLTVDWSCSDGTHTCNIPTDYCKIVRQIDSIGHKVGEFLAWIHDVLGVDGSTTELYGHSLGCHISGGAARQFRARMGTNISIIVGEQCFQTFLSPTVTVAILIVPLNPFWILEYLTWTRRQSDVSSL